MRKYENAIYEEINNFGIYSFSSAEIYKISVRGIARFYSK